MVQTTKWSAQGQTGNLTLGIGSRPRPFNRLWGAKGDPDLEEVMSTLVGFGTFAALLEEQISEKISRRILSGDQGMLVWWSIGVFRRGIRTPFSG